MISNYNTRSTSKYTGIQLATVLFLQVVGAKTFDTEDFSCKMWTIVLW